MEFIIFFILSAMFHHERETTRNNTTEGLTYKLVTWLSPKLWLYMEDWYTTNRWDTKSWWIKMVFSLFNDGWKWWDWWMGYCFSYPFAYIFVQQYNLPTTLSFMPDWFGLTWVYAWTLFGLGGLYHNLFGKTFLHWNK